MIPQRFARVRRLFPYSRLVRQRPALAVSITAAFAAFSTAAVAQTDAPNDDESEKQSPAEQAGAQTEASTGKGETPGATVTDRSKDEGDGEPFQFPLLSWNGSIEWDLGRAEYESEDPGQSDDSLSVHQGRFVLAPLLHIDVTHNLSFQATAQFVAQIRQETGLESTADDVYAKFGNLGLWDIQVGRFEAWRVYNKFPIRDWDARPEVAISESIGAFDLFTLEDLGALCNPRGNAYCESIYEVDTILFRDTYGSVAFHLFPLEGLGIELHGKYGEQADINRIGGRLAVIYSPLSFLELSAAGESIIDRPGREIGVTVDPTTGIRTVCETCSDRDAQGFGGGFKLRFPWFEIAGSYARNQIDSFRGDGLVDVAGSPIISSYGGYAHVNIGPITVGGAVHYTLREAPPSVPDRQDHLQSAAFIYWPFFERLSVKLVGTYAEGTDDPFLERTAPDPIGATRPFTNSALAARIRLKYFFNTL